MVARVNRVNDGICSVEIGAVHWPYLRLGCVQINEYDADAHGYILSAHTVRRCCEVEIVGTKTNDNQNKCIFCSKTVLGSQIRVVVRRSAGY